MRATEKDNGSTLTVAVGKTVTISLPANPSTGYSWVRAGQPKSENLGSNDALRLDSTFVPGPHRMIGAPGSLNIKVTPLEKGTHTVTLVYQRPWEPTTGNEKTYTITIEAS